jgi:cell division protein FtsZ
MSIRYDSDLLPDIKVVGVGGGGCNAVTRMVRAKIPGVTFVACNTDAPGADVLRGDHEDPHR